LFFFVVESPKELENIQQQFIIKTRIKLPT